MTVRPIGDVAAGLGIRPEHVIRYGNDKAKIALDARAASGRPTGRLVLVSAITPTDAGEGKTTTSIGLAQGLARIGERACLALREPSLGPTFGLKGGATGGGRARVVPDEDDQPALHRRFSRRHDGAQPAGGRDRQSRSSPERLDIDPRRVVFGRSIDMNDRSLRELVVGQGGGNDGVPREAVRDHGRVRGDGRLWLSGTSTTCKRRLWKILVGLDAMMGAGDGASTSGRRRDGGPAQEKRVDPNLVQTVEGVPAFVHCGPFANIAHGCNSLLATRMALRYADYIVTEAGLFRPRRREVLSYQVPDRRAPTGCGGPGGHRAGAEAPRRGRQRPPDQPRRGRGRTGAASTSQKHIENIHTFWEPPVVALNRFAADTDEEIAVVRRACEAIGVPFAVSDHFARGGDGAVDLARVVAARAERHARPFCPLYRWTSRQRPRWPRSPGHDWTAAREVTWSREAERDLALAHSFGFDGLPLCVAKTPKSLSDDPSKLGRPEELRHRRAGDAFSAAGAGYLVPLLGDIMRMPGLPASPAAERMDVVDGRIVGISPA